MAGGEPRAIMLLRRGWPVLVLVLAVGVLAFLDWRGGTADPKLVTPSRQQRNPVADPRIATGIPPGPDVNGDGRSDVLDALCLLRAVGGYGATANCPQPLTVNDVNGDAKLDALDALCLLRNVAGFEATENCPLGKPGAAAAAAAAGPPVSVRVQPAQVQVAPGQSTIVTIESDVPAGGFGAWTLEISYDPAVVKPAACTATLPNAAALCNLNPIGAPNTIRVTNSTTTSVTERVARLATVTLEATGQAGAASPLGVTVVTFTDQQGVALPTTVSPGALTIR